MYIALHKAKVQLKTGSCFQEGEIVKLLDHQVGQHSLTQKLTQ